MDEETVRRLVGDMDAAVDANTANRYRDTRKLVFSAVEALLQWLADADRFPAEWIHAVGKLFGIDLHRRAGVVREKRTVLPDGGSS